MDINQKLEETADWLNKEITNYLKEPEEIKNLHEGAEYAVGSGGKRLRPFLALEVCKLLGGEEKKAMPFAAACELLHNWLLVHDDIEDGDRVRRDQPAVWVKYGLGHGVNIGDMMAHKVYEIIFHSEEKGVDGATILKLINLVTVTTLHTARGQAMDMNMRNTDSPTEEEYMKTVKQKTGYYLACPMIGGAIIAGATEKELNTLIKYGECIGPAFQIKDDVLDLTAGKGRGGAIGNDIKEGKRSLLVIHAASRSSSGEKTKLFSILNKPREETTQEEVEWVVKLFEKYNSIEYAQKKAEALVAEAKKTIADLPPQLKEFLEEMADFMVLRKK